MRTVVQRVASARLSLVSEGGAAREHASIEHGLVALVGLEARDADVDLQWTAGKLTGLRVFPDDEGKMSLDVRDVAGHILLVPNFTVAGDTGKGRRPSFDNAMPPARARSEFDRFVESVRVIHEETRTGVFAAHMLVEIANDGPVTIWLDSRK